ncbi:FeoB-associated Cys-rich membrane protein [Alcaligenes faecalis]|nr:FeoB-associated Cys-rich membrane protein [Alcaligenes faecalis]
MAQTVIVTLVVLAALLYIVWRYMPQKWRNSLSGINPKLAHPPGCGGCSRCDAPSDARTRSCHSSAPLKADDDARPVIFHKHPGTHPKN